MSEEGHALLGRYSQYTAVWVESTSSDHLHGGAGWEFGTCLWSPSRNAAGHDRYATMRMPKKGNLVLHVYHHAWEDGSTERRLCGSSLVKDQFREVDNEPPSPGVWKGQQPYYRIELEGYRPFPRPLSLRTLEAYYGQEIRDEIIRDAPYHYPFYTHGEGIRLVQGLYLTFCTERLYDVFRKALGLASATAANTDTTFAPHETYYEGERMAAERYFFARNPQLVKRAKELYGYRCQVCAFDYEAAYGQLGRGYIECHHLNPLSERSETEWTQTLSTSLDDVAVVCANCHRMLHRRRPALTLSALRANMVVPRS